MSNNIHNVNFYQTKIDNIVVGVPPLFDRLNVVMNPNIINNLIEGDDGLWKIRRIMQRQYYDNLPRVPARSITRDTVTMKHAEVEQLKAEVLELIKRCESVIPRPTLHDLLSGDGAIFRGPFDALYVWGLYEDYLEEELFRARLSSVRDDDDDYSD